MVEENAPVCVVDIPAYDAPPIPGAISMPITDSPTTPPTGGDVVDEGGRGALAVLLAVVGITAMHLIGG